MWKYLDGLPDFDEKQQMLKLPQVPKKQGQILQN